jgi:hypothetical protein
VPVASVTGVDERVGRPHGWIGGDGGSAASEVVVPSKEQVNALVAQGLDYPEIGRRLGIPAGQAYLIGTGTPVDDGHAGNAQHLANPPHDNPTRRQIVHDWIAGRVAADEQMRWAGTARRAKAEGGG